jgi:hypothetical protein
MPDSWVVRYGFQNAEIGTRYQVAVYWAFTTLTTVGYGDISAFTYTEKCVAIGMMIFGCAAYSYTIGNLQTILNEIDEKQYNQQLKLDTLLAFSTSAGLDTELYENIARYIINNASRVDKIPLQIRQLLEDLPMTLKGDIVNQAFEETIDSITFFQDKPSDFLWHFLPKLQQMNFFNGDHLYF